MLLLEKKIFRPNRKYEQEYLPIEATLKPQRDKVGLTPMTLTMMMTSKGHKNQEQYLSYKSWPMI